MSLLAPFYFAGALAIGLPILFHLIRRRPRGEIHFSSLMFLRPTPPRLTRRSRLDNWPLLLIRALALMLLAAAFARPFLRSTSQTDSDLPRRRMVIAVDTSASMQRAGLWEQAKAKVDEILSDLRPGDEIALVAFDNEPTTLLRFDQASGISPTQVRSSVNTLLADTTPSWAGTDLGRAIGYAADLAVTYEPESSVSLSENPQDASAADASRHRGPTQLILVTDMQAGSKVESLQVYSWPDRLSLDIRQVSSNRRNNAAAQVLRVRDNESDEKNRVRVRVYNSGDADQSSYRISWIDADGKPIEATGLPIQVPPGQSRVVQMPAPYPGVTALTLEGDDHDFDNTWYVVSPQPESLTLLNLGAESADSQVPDPRSSLLYYLQRVPLSTNQRTVTTQTMSPDQLTEVPDPKNVPLVVVTDPCSTNTAGLLRKYVVAGGQLLYVLADQRRMEGSVDSLRTLTDVSELKISEAVVDDYVMLSRIDFRHPLFARMSDPQFNDFTKIRFWSHRTLSDYPESWHVLARFDDGDPALVEQIIGAGKMWVLAAGWQPEASQLALSSKFIPLIFSLFDPSTGTHVDGNQFSVGDRVPLAPSPTAHITLPSGEEISYQSPDDFQSLDWPGVYSITGAESSRSIVVNLDSDESRTEAMGADELERYGIRLGSTLSTAAELSNRNRLRDSELESKQRLWQWLLVAALVMLGLETLLGGMLSKSQPTKTEATPV
ncbi:hypothetical protein Q31b_38810 [Novipirellula aureliae]|uniref:VWFA domain-containing protein n=1 Tax=Novipirellula aureliae TaxID=2527966 RepID=A0A5C6DNE1_9BACT|nr:BatA domain-containing protein [Novipirellula aureliae]TWU38803.1 hypothetical protein Q31b_38810 [Novipirellula aureliae]